MTTDLDRALARVKRKSKGLLNRGASAAAIALAGKALGSDLPEDVRRLYRDHDGATQGALRARLMTLDEAIETNESLADLDLAESGLRLFWTDDESNHAGVFVAGPLLGLVALHQHDDVDLSPRFASVASFLEALAGAKADVLELDELPADFPLAADATPEALARAAAVRAAVAGRAAGGRRRDLELALVALSPPDEPERLLPYLTAEAPVAARACALVASRGVAAAVPVLLGAALESLGSPCDAIVALGKIRTAEALDALERIAAAGSATYPSAVQDALRAHGCEIKVFDADNIEYRTPRGMRWRRIGPAPGG